MKTPLEVARTREYPHLVLQGSRLLEHKALYISNAPFEGRNADDSRTFIGEGMLNPSGTITPLAREKILASIAREAKERPRSGICIVWSATECTWLDKDGRAYPGTRPPKATETLDPYLYERLPLDVEDCFIIPLPAGSSASHLCIQRLGPKHVEITPGESMLLAMLDDPIGEEERDPLAHLFDEDGNVVVPSRFRGQPVTEFDGISLYGPIQPSDDGIVLRQPFPNQVKTACERIAGRALPQDVLDRAWRAVRMDELDYAPVGVLTAH